MAPPVGSGVLVSNTAGAPIPDAAVEFTASICDLPIVVILNVAIFVAGVTAGVGVSIDGVLTAAYMPGPSRNFPASIGKLADCPVSLNALMKSMNKKDATRVMYFIFFIPR